MEDKRNEDEELDLSQYSYYLDYNDDQPSPENNHSEYSSDSKNEKKEYYGELPSQKSPRKKKKKTLKIILLSLVGVLVLTIAAGVIYIDSLFNKIEYDTDTDLSYNDYTPDIETNDPDSPNIGNEENETLENFGGEPMSNPNIKNILLIGRDTEESKSNARSDVMVLISINKEKQTVKMSSFQRDIYAYIPGKGYDKLNHAHSYAGPKLTIQTLEGNFHVKIDNYMSVNFTTFRNIVDILGGVDMNLSAAEAKYLKNELAALGYTSFDAGTYHLKGQAALSYCRIRYIDSDRERTQRHRNMLNAITDQHKSINLAQAIQLLEQCLPLVKTDFTKGELMSTMVDAISYVQWPRSEIVMPVEGASNNATVRGMFVITLDWATNVKALQNFIYGDQ